MTLDSTSRPFTWETSDFAWESPYSDNTWNTAAICDYTLTQDESLTLSDQKRAACHLSRRAGIALTDYARRHTLFCRREEVPAAESFHRISRYVRAHGENLTIGASSHRIGQLVRSDTVSLAEQQNRSLGLRRTAALRLDETHRPHSTMHRAFRESGNLLDRIAKHTAHPTQNALRLRDARLSTYDTILSDVTFSRGTLTDELWQKSATSPSGYGSFHPFEVGEYTYRNALIRLLLTTGAAGADPLLYDVAFHVDIEDVREHGIAECTADSTAHITLKRHYYHPPRIALTVIGGTDNTATIAYLINQSVQDGFHTFDCELRTPSGTRISGTVSYLAEGY